MSLIRQVWLLLLATLLLAFAGGVVVSISAARDTLETQLRLKNSDNATALAMVLSQQKGERQTMELVMTAQFDTGFFRRIGFTPADGSAPFVRRSDSRPQQAPLWFVELLPIDSTPGVAQVSDGWRALGAVEVVSHSAYAHDDLWRASLQAAGALTVVGVLSGLVAALLLGRIRRPLEATVAQARSLERGEYVTVPEPGTTELRRLTRAMNSMVARLKLVFEGQAAQVEALRRQVNCDALTGLSNRAHFIGQLTASLRSEDGHALGGLVLLRVLDLAGLNRMLGHAGTDRVIGVVGQVLQTYVQRVGGSFAGRLNGSDFALALPAAGVAAETARTLSDTLRALLGATGGHAAVAAGALEVEPGREVAEHLSAADLALARAEGGGAFAVETVGEAAGVLARLGEGAWRKRIEQALAESRLQLAGFAVVAPDGGVLHLDCPLRIQLEPDGPFEVAARWLPLALRGRLTALVDERAVALALTLIEQDGAARAVNIAPASLADSGFAARLRARLERSPRAARGLWIEVAEAAAADHFELLHELGRQVRPLGVRLGLEHAGERLSRLERLIELGLDYVKLDAAVCHGVGADDARASLVRSITTMLHSLSLQVVAEGVADGADAQALWAAGVDAMTGPWVSAQRAAQAA
jgi:EAL domain-containing protein (putative c-di-GMP-specific phosphodiesterase class I)